MSRVTFVRRLAACGIALGTTLLILPATSSAADMDDYEQRYSARPYPPEPVPQYEPRYSPPPVYGREYDPPPRRRVEVDAEGCRVIFKRRVDPYGREITRRIRDCDDRVASRGWREPPRRYGPPVVRERYEVAPEEYRRPVAPEIDEDLD